MIANISLGQIFTILFLATLVQAQVDEFERMKKSTLKLVVQVFRHGARYPVYETYDGAEQMSKNGELTPVGIRQQYELGRKLREEYIVKRKFLSESFNIKELFVRSTDVTRTLMSAQSQLAGFYPYGTGPKIPPTIKSKTEEQKKALTDAPQKFFDTTLNLQLTEDEFAIPQGLQPIPIHTIEESKDKLLLGHSYACPNSKGWKEANKKSDVWNRIRTELAEPIKKFATIMKVAKPDEFDLFKLQQTMDTVITDYFQDRTVPQELLNDKDFWQKIEELLMLEIHLELFQTQQQKHVSITPFYNSLIGYFEKNLNKTAPYKWYMHSAHDTTVSMILVGMNLTNWECMERYHTNKLAQDEICLYKPTSYATNIIYELREDPDTKENFIMFTLNGEYQPVCDMKSKYCSLKEFKERVNNWVVPDFDQQCGLAQNQNAKDEKITEDVSFSSLLIITNLFLLLNLLL